MIKVPDREQSHQIEFDWEKMLQNKVKRNGKGWQVSFAKSILQFTPIYSKRAGLDEIQRKFNVSKQNS
jgi:hypothetical protein